MPNLRVALFDSRTSAISAAIRWITRSQYNHAAIVLRDGSVIESVEGVGVHHIPTLPAPTGGDRIDLFEVYGLTDDQADKIEAFLKAQLGKPYDWPDIAGFLTKDQHEAIAGRDKWFCSELVFAAVAAGGINLLQRTAPYEVSPGILSLSPFLIPSASIP